MTIDNRDLITALRAPPSRFRRFKARLLQWLLVTAAIGIGTILMLLERLGHLIGICAGTH